jgi:glutamate-5-semialdehyde dehydrogenase
MMSNPESNEQLIQNVARQARAAGRQTAVLSTQQKNRALEAIAQTLLTHEGLILQENQKDVERARQAGVAEPLVDRLALNPARIRGMVDSVREIAAQTDPVGEVLGLTRRPNGLLVGEMRIPLGVIAMIYEARPNVTVDAAALTFKSGNAVILRGGSDASTSNHVLGGLLRDCLRDQQLPEHAIQVLPPLDRDATKVLLAQSGLIDLVIPRGGYGLIKFVTEHARVPVIQHFQGVCHVFVDEGADPVQAEAVVVNGKTQRPGTCNATECLLIHEAALDMLPTLAASLLKQGVEIRGCPRTQQLIPQAVPAQDSDWGCEFLDKILAVRVVSSFEEAVAHINRYGSNHTETICTRSYERAQRWLREVDASCVLVNASTRFNDGGQLGLGAEIGISTSKLHAFGPMGAVHLTTKKWVVYGEGQIRE